jgi:hypothetical protein
MARGISGKLIGTLLFAAVFVPRIAFATATPGAGIYSVSSYVVSASATNGGTCGAPQGYYLSSDFSYPGASKAGAVERHSINGPNGSYIQELDFPETPAAGVKTWSGDYIGRIYPGASSVRGTFSAALTFVDANSFLATITYKYPVSQDSVCTTVFSDTFIRIGH